MNIIICGAGEVGYSLAKYLSTDNMKVTLIDEDLEKLEPCRPKVKLYRNGDAILEPIHRTRLVNRNL